jgi:hypothetical protein
VNLAQTPEYRQAITLWAKGEYWEVHEVLEPLWLRLAGPERELTQGIILLAAALHKAKTSHSGGWRNFDKAIKHLNEVPGMVEGVGVQALVEEVRRALNEPQYVPRWEP